VSESPSIDPTAAAVDGSLRGCVAVVTGGAAGIGRATCWAFAAAGARIVVLDRDAVACHEAAEELRRGGADALAVVADVANKDDVEAASRETASAFGGCDVLVNNAAIVTWFGLEDLEVTEWERVLSINLTGAFLCMQFFGRQMLNRGRGSIVNVASVAASSPEIGAGAYAPAKAGLAMLTRQAAVEWGPRGVRVNAVSPGVIDTGQASQFLQDAASVRRRKRMIPLGRFGDPGEVARIITFLASDASSYVNGQNLEVDGGLMQMMLRVLPHPGIAEEI
jgi:NAD(P)-dependent dehydrogenase (short-subunit alcohol dehydrogenase family)